MSEPRKERAMGSSFRHSPVPAFHFCSQCGTARSPCQGASTHVTVPSLSPENLRSPLPHTPRPPLHPIAWVADMQKRNTIRIRIGKEVRYRLYLHSGDPGQHHSRMAHPRIASLRRRPEIQCPLPRRRPHGRPHRFLRSQAAHLQYDRKEADAPSIVFAKLPSAS